jgi:hypothetical protein
VSVARSSQTAPGQLLAGNGRTNVIACIGQHQFYSTSIQPPSTAETSPELWQASNYCRLTLALAKSMSALPPQYMPR